TGQPYWTYDTLASVWSSPLVADGKVYLGDEDGDVVILQHGKEKKVLAEINMGSAVYATPVPAHGTLFLNNRNELFALAVKLGCLSELRARMIFHSLRRSGRAFQKMFTFRKGADGVVARALYFKMRFQTFRLSDHPVCGASVASRLLIDAAATPPLQGGEYALPRFIHTFFRPRPLLVAVLFLIVATFPSAGQTHLAALLDEWRQFRGTPGLTGVANSTPPAFLKPLWKLETGDMIESSAAIVDGVVYVGVGKGDLIAVDLASGKLRWKYATGNYIG